MENYLGEILYVVLTVIVLIGSAIIKMFEKKKRNAQADRQQSSQTESVFSSIFDDPYYEPEIEEEIEEEEPEISVSVPIVKEPVRQIYSVEEEKPESVIEEISKGGGMYDWNKENTSVKTEKVNALKNEDNEQRFDWRQGIIMSEILKRKYFSL